MRPLITLVAASLWVAGMLLPTPSPAAEANPQDWNVEVGVSASRHADPTGTLWVQRHFHERSMGHHFSWQPVVGAGVFAPHGEAGYDNTVVVAGGGARIHYRPHPGRRWPVFLEVQALGAAGRTEAISGSLQFGTALGWERDRWDLTLRHVSNAGLKGSNRGETMLLLGWRF